MSMREMQESRYTVEVDYRVGSPHLQHRAIFDRLTALICDNLTVTTSRGLPSSVLEVGAGHGGMTEPVLARGYRVTVTEMSRASADILRRRYSVNDRLRVLHDPDGTLTGLGDERFATLLCSSVLHHIPDYLGFLDRVVKRHMLVGGSLVSVQDPLVYDRIRSLTHRFDRGAYLAWRLTLGNRRAGLSSLSRRLRGAYSDSEPGDMVEYHVVRRGLDEEAIYGWLERRFEEVVIDRYWSNQSALAQRIGDRMSIENTFAMQARGYRGEPQVARFVADGLAG